MFGRRPDFGSEYETVGREVYKRNRPCCGSRINKETFHRQKVVDNPSCYEEFEIHISLVAP